MKKRLGLFVRDHMQPAPIVVREDKTIHQALMALRNQNYEGKILYFYVVDSEGKLQGVVSSRALLLADPLTTIHSIMDKSIFCLEEGEEVEKAMEELSRHRLLALPVVDKEKRLKGIFDIQVCLEENIDLFKAQRSQDVFQLVGMSLEEGAHKSPIRSYSKRMPWILCNVLGGLGCAMVSSFFYLVLAKVLILAMFIPLVLSLSESISMQSMTQSLQMLRNFHGTKGKMVARIWQEIRVALLMAMTSGVLVGVASLLWNKDFVLASTISIGIVFSIFFSAIIGSCVPLLLHLKKFDPKVASGPVVLTIADIMTTAIYLSLATWWLL